MNDETLGFYAFLAVCFLVSLALALVIARWLQGRH